MYLIFKVSSYERYDVGGWDDFWRAASTKDEAIQAIIKDGGKEYTYQLVDLRSLTSTEYSWEGQDLTHAG